MTVREASPESLVLLRGAADRFALTGGLGVPALGRYVDLLVEYPHANVTGLRSREAIVSTLIEDSLALLDAVAVAGAHGLPEGPLSELATVGPKWADLGAGAGLPGIPLAVALPEIELTLVESVAKKCRFLEEAVAAAGIAARARVVCARSERFAAAGQPGREAFTVVLARALGPLATVVELAAPLLARNGVVLASKTRRAVAEEGAWGEAAGLACGLAPCPIVPLPRSPLAESVCAVFRKVAPTPPWLPRREGVARSRPLGRR